MKLSKVVVLGMVFAFALPMACSKDDDNEKDRTKATDKDGDGQGDGSGAIGKSSKPKGPANPEEQGGQEAKVAGLEGSWDLVLDSDTEFQWTFAKDSISKKITCYDANGKAFSATATAPGSFDESKIYIEESASESASSESGSVTCSASFVKGEYDYQLNDDRTMTMHYGSVVWKFNPAK